jgi:hypothetical protein
MQTPSRRSWPTGGHPCTLGAGSGSTPRAGRPLSALLGDQEDH